MAEPCTCHFEPAERCPHHRRLITPPTDPAPPLEQRPAFELVSATLWTVVVAFRPQPDVAPVHAELHLLTASADGSEVYPLAIARARELSPQALEITVTAVQRRGEVTGTVARRPRRPS